MVRGLGRDPQTSGLAPGVRFTLPPRVVDRKDWWAGKELNLRPPPARAGDALSLSYLPMVRGLRRDPQTSRLSPGMHFTPSPRIFHLTDSACSGLQSWIFLKALRACPEIGSVAKAVAWLSRSGSMKR